MSLASKDLMLNDKLYSTNLINGTDFFLGKLLKNESIKRVAGTDIITLKILTFENMPNKYLLNNVNIFDGLNPTGIDNDTKMFNEI